MWRAVVVSVAVAAASALVIAPAPDYDPWAWLVWGREIAGGSLSTVDGPAFKPLPVAVCIVLSAFGGAAPWLWVVIARAGAVLAVWLAFRAGRRLAGAGVTRGGDGHPVGGDTGPVGGGVALLGGVLAAAAVLASSQFVHVAAGGLAEGLLIALALAGLEAWRAGRPGWALGCGVACASIRVEAWPFLLAAGIVAWRRHPRLRPALAIAAAGVPAAWLVPELIGSGDVLRSGTRARIPNPGQPALADVPALASLGAAAAIPPWPVWAGLPVLAWRRVAPAAWIAAAGFAWLALVAFMAQAGFSGEARYALPGAALVAIAGGAMLARLPRAAGLAAGVVLVALAVPHAVDVRARQAHAWALQRDLAVAVRAAGGRAGVLACGTPYVGPYRGPLMAYRLGVERRVVQPDGTPRPPGVIFRSALTAASPPRPDAPRAFGRVARAGSWSVLATC